MKSGTIYVGDCRKVLPNLPAASVDCVITSPPYWGLRDYGTAEWVGGDSACPHNGRSKPRQDSAAGTGAAFQGDRGGQASKAFADVDRSTCRHCGARRVDDQIGLEPVPDCAGLGCGECYVCHLVAVFREVRRILKPTGVLWLNLGDCWNSNAGDYRGIDSSGLSGSLKREGADLRPQGRPRFKGLKPKDQVGIPWRVALALQADGWYLRKDVIEEVELYCPCGCGHVLEERIWRHAPDRVVAWEKPDPMPESVTDRPTASHEYLFLLSKSARYFYDAEAVREPMTSTQRRWVHPPRVGVDVNGGHQGSSGNWDHEHLSGRNKRSVWKIATQPYRGAHFATMPEALVVPCVLAGTSTRGVCPACGAPWERGVDPQNMDRPQSRRPDELLTAPVAVGWEPTCGHRLEPVPATVFDPFLGSGTVAMVASGHGRRWAGIELSAHSARELAVDRIGSMFCDVVDQADAEAPS